MWIYCLSVPVKWDEIEEGDAFDEKGKVSIGSVSNAESRLIPQPALVDFATRWFN